MIVERMAHSGSVEVLERVLDKGIVIDAWVRVALVGIDLIRVEARVIVASIETYLKYAEPPELASPPELAVRAVRAEPEVVAVPARRRPGARKSLSPAEVTRVVRAALHAWNGHDAQSYAGLLDEGYVGETHAVPVTLHGRGAARRAMRMKLAIFPDLKFELQNLLTAGDEALVSWTATGTRNRRRVRVSGCTVARLRAGKIDHTWCYWDTADMLAPLRVVRDGPHTLHRFTTTS